MQLRREDVTWRELEGRTVILDLASSTYLTTNRSGALLLKSLVEDRSHDDLVSLLADEYGIPSDRADADVSAFTGLLGDHGLLVGADGRSDGQAADRPAN